jgi:hypothetical protein
MDSIASLALLLGVAFPSLEVGASSSGKFQGSKGGVVDTPGPDQGRVLFAEDDETRVELFEVLSAGGNNVCCRLVGTNKLVFCTKDTEGCEVASHIKKANKVKLMQGDLFIPCPQGRGRTTPCAFISPSRNISDLPTAIISTLRGRMTAMCWTQVFISIQEGADDKETRKVASRTAVPVETSPGPLWSQLDGWSFSDLGSCAAEGSYQLARGKAAGDGQKSGRFSEEIAGWIV